MTTVGTQTIPDTWVFDGKEWFDPAADIRRYIVFLENEIARLRIDNDSRRIANMIGKRALDQLVTEELRIDVSDLNIEGITAVVVFKNDQGAEIRPA